MAVQGKGGGRSGTGVPKETAAKAGIVAATAGAGVPRAGAKAQARPSAAEPAADNDVISMIAAPRLSPVFQKAGRSPSGFLSQ